MAKKYLRIRFSAIIVLLHHSVPDAPPLTRSQQHTLPLLKIFIFLFFYFFYFQRKAKQFLSVQTCAATFAGCLGIVLKNVDVFVVRFFFGVTISLL